MRRQQNYYSELEAEAEALLRAVGHSGGPLGERRVTQIAEHLGFELHPVPDLPQGVRSLTDERNGRIYLPLAGTRGVNPRAAILQALGHHVLGHNRPTDFADFLSQRVEVNYLAGALLIPQVAAVDMLSRAKQGRYLAVEDLRDAFAVTYEMAGHRFTNLVTHHLELPVHFMKVHESGTVIKVYENDGLPMTTDSEGSAEGQFACRHRPARMAFQLVPPETTHYQYFDTTAGTFWSSVQVDEAGFSVSVGVRFDDARWFRGRDTTLRSTSTCPDPACCRRPDLNQIKRWEHRSRPATTAHTSLLATLPPGAYPGVDDTEVYAFLDRHAKA